MHLFYCFWYIVCVYFHVTALKFGVVGLLFMFLLFSVVVALLHTCGLCLCSSHWVGSYLADFFRRISFNKIFVILIRIYNSLVLDRVNNESTLNQIMMLDPVLMHWGRDKIAANSLTFSNGSSWMRICKFRLRFHLSLFPMVLFTIFHHWFR